MRTRSLIVSLGVALVAACGDDASPPAATSQPSAGQTGHAGAGGGAQTAGAGQAGTVQAGAGQAGAGQAGAGQAGAAQAGAGQAGGGGAAGATFPFPDFHLPGTQAGTLDEINFLGAASCKMCHAPEAASPHPTWSGSLMGLAGRDPLFFAQMTNANQDVPGVGYYCQRCHVPMGMVTGAALDPTGKSLTAKDKDGVSCQLCHTLVDPLGDPAKSPKSDAAILAALPERPQHHGNAMMVIDPSGLRRGPYDDASPPHAVAVSPFFRSSDLCGTCHDVGNPAVSRQPGGGYAYNPFGQPPADHDPRAQFPLERTYTEWKLSAFAQGGVDMGGVFGGDGAGVVSTCQDCHMPRTKAAGCIDGPVRSDLRKHEFAGASAWVIDIIGKYAANDPAVDPVAIAAGKAAAISMLQRSATVEAKRAGANLAVRVTNQSGHKLPTGHIEGRRAWVNVVFRDKDGAVVAERGKYDYAEAELDEASTTVFEMHIGLSPAAAAKTGLPAGPTTHMSLADTIEKDTRIPPRGFDPATYEPAGAGALGLPYAKGQHWADLSYAIPTGATSATVTVYYQTVTRHYIEALRDGNHTDHWGDTLYQLWLQTDRNAPVAITSTTTAL